MADEKMDKFNDLNFTVIRKDSRAYLLKVTSYQTGFNLYIMFHFITDVEFVNFRKYEVNRYSLDNKILYKMLIMKD